MARRYVHFALLFVIYIMATAPLCAIAENSNAARATSRYDELRQRYFRLRNTDMAVKKRSEWRSVAKDLQQLTIDFPTAPETAQALWNLSHLYQELFRVERNDRDALRSLSSLTTLLSRFRSHELADDALFRAAGLQQELFDDPGAVRDLYKRLIQRFPESEYALKARKELDSGNIQIKQKGAGGVGSVPMLRKRRWVVVLDPGHGGEDLGAKGAAGLYEKDVVLAISLEAELLLEKNTDIQVELTRREDEFIPLAERTHFANAWNADVFVSLHNNASERAALSGLQVFFLDAAGDEAGRLLAERENGVEAAVLDDVDLILGDLTQSAKQEPSITLAHLIQDSILSETRPVWKEVKNSGVRPGPFYVLTGAHMPCALVEMFFIDHVEDGRKLATQRFRGAVARGLDRGVRAFLDRQ